MGAVLRRTECVEPDSRRRARLSGSPWRFLSLAILVAASTCWLAPGVAYASTPPWNTGLPTISGNAVQGGTLTAAPGTWTGDAPISFSYQWSDGHKGITDTLSAADVGQPLTLTVTASNAAGQASATSAPVGPVLPAAPQNSRPPVITGTAQQGHTLTAGTGVWSNTPTAYAYAWQQCSNRDQTSCSTISGATANTYALHASDVGKYMSVVVTASNAGG